MIESTAFAEDGVNPAPLKKSRLATSAADLLAESNGDRPIWVRAPKRGVERYSSLSRAKLYQLASERRIKSASLREPGQIRGCRLFLLSSILAYIEANEM